MSTQESLNQSVQMTQKHPRKWLKLSRINPNWSLTLTQNDVQPMTNELENYKEQMEHPGGWKAVPVKEFFDLVSRPSHYIDGRKIEPIAVIEDWKLPYHLGNVLKYISRAGRKGKDTEYVDLMKAAFYLNRYIEQIKGTNSGTLD